MKQPRIISLVGREIAGYHMNLHKGFDQLGITNHFFYERTHPFYHYSKKRNVLEKFITALNDIIVAPKNSFIKKIVLLILLYPLVIALKIALFPVLILQYDVFIFSANYSYLGLYIDRWILKLFGKTMIDVALGSDARPPYLNGIYTDARLFQIRRDSLFKKWRVVQKVKTATYIIDHPTTSQFNTRPYIPLLYMGLPFLLSDNGSDIKENTIPLILHAPSNPKIKGTDTIRAIIADLQKDYTFEYRELVGLPHSEVLSALQKCAFVINELYSDTLMAGLDTEAAWFGKPSIVGGYNLKMVEETMAGYDIPPTYRIFPSTDALKEAIVHLLEDKKHREELGKSAQKFVKSHWNAESVAQKYLDIIQGNIPENIMRSPYEDFDIHGCGINTADRRNLMRGFIKKYGDKALLLQDKEILKKHLIDDISTPLSE